MKRFKVRFNLGRGDNYKKWKITHPSGEVEYIEPDKWRLFMWEVELKNNRKTAERIYNGENKSVCSWILCNNICIKPYPSTWRSEDYKGGEIKYNPRVKPHWVHNDKDVDNERFQFIFSSNKQLFNSP